MDGNCTGWSGDVSDANRRAVPDGDAHLSSWRYLHVHVDAIHRRVLDCFSHADNRLAGIHISSEYTGRHCLECNAISTTGDIEDRRY